MAKSEVKQEKPKHRFEETETDIVGKKKMICRCGVIRYSSTHWLNQRVQYTKEFFKKKELTFSKNPQCDTYD